MRDLLLHRIPRDKVNAAFRDIEGHECCRSFTGRGITIGAAKVEGRGEKQSNRRRLRVSREISDRLRLISCIKNF